MTREKLNEQNIFNKEKSNVFYSLETPRDKNILPRTNVTGPAKIDHVSTKKSPIFSVFAVS